MLHEARKPTAMQMRAIDYWKAGGFKSKAKALRQAGYGDSIVDQPHKVFGSLAVIKELELRGFDEWGRHRSPTSETLAEPAPVKGVNLDFSELSKKELQVLKEKLGDIGLKGREQVEISSSIPMSDDVDIFVAGLEVPKHPASF